MVTQKQSVKWVNDDGYTMLEIKTPTEAYIQVATADVKKLRDLSDACHEAANYLESLAEVAAVL